jgi:hypothetical protein
LIIIKKSFTSAGDIYIPIYDIYFDVVDQIVSRLDNDNNNDNDDDDDESSFSFKFDKHLGNCICVFIFIVSPSSLLLYYQHNIV